MATHVQSYTLGKGKIYFQPSGEDGERYLGNTPGLTLSITSEKLEHFSSETGISEKDDSTLVKVARASQLVCDDISEDNLALFVIGTADDVAQTGTAVTDEAFTVKQDRFYQLGVAAAFVTGKQGISLVTVTGSGGTPTYDVNDDYEVDATLGRIYIVPGGAIADDTDILVDYTYATNSRRQIATGTSSGTVGALRYIADNPKGTNRDYFMPQVEMSPSGDFALKSDPESPAYVTLTFDVDIQTRDTTTAQLYIDGRAA